MLLIRITLSAFLFLVGSLVCRAQDIEWIQQHGGTDGWCETSSVVVNTSGEVFVNGSFNGSVEIPKSNTAYQWVSAGFNDVFIAKLDSKGTILRADHFSGTGFEIINSLKADNNGNCYVLGSFDKAINFDPGTNTNRLNAIGKRDLFLVKIGPSGEVLWDKHIGVSGGSVLGQSMVLLESGDIIVTGGFEGTVKFDPAKNDTEKSSEGNQGDMFVFRVSKQGSLQWIQHIRSSGALTGGSMALDKSGHIHIVGGGWGKISFFQNGATRILKEGRFPVRQFILTLSDDGNIIDHIDLLTSTGGGLMQIQSNSEGDIIGSGVFTDSLNFMPPSPQDLLISRGLLDMILVYIKPDKTLEWVETFGGTKDDLLTSMLVDVYDNIYIAGAFRDSIFLGEDNDAQLLHSSGNKSSFIGVLNSSGEWIHLDEFLGQQEVHASSIGLDPLNNALYCSGSFNGQWEVGLDNSTQSLTTANKKNDGFLLKLPALINTHNEQKFDCAPLTILTLNDGREIELLKDHSWRELPQTIEIGDDTWMLKNLDVDKFRDGSIIPRTRTAQDWEDAWNNQQPAWCYYQNDSTNSASYGKLYNWYAVNDPRGLAPCGWYIPNYNDLRSLLRQPFGNGWGLIDKDTWNTIDTRANNSTGFSALPTGIRTGGPSQPGFRGEGYLTHFWSSTSLDGKDASTLLLNFRGTNFFHQMIPLEKGSGLPVRVMRTKDQN